MSDKPIGFTWQFSDRRTWSCRFLRHRACCGHWKVQAVTYVGERASDRREVDAFVACPCGCHGTIP